MRKAINLSIQRVCGVCIIFSFLATPTPAYQSLSPFWASEIDSALNVRDEYYKKKIPEAPTFSLVALNKIQQSDLCDRLTASPDSGNPWYNFLTGILQCSGEKNTSSGYFASALTLAQQDPGTTWALFVEFTRNNQSMWAERCIMHLEKLLLSSGAKAAPAIAQQLLYYAALSEKQKDYTGAFNYYRWAERFDRNQPWSLVHRLWYCLPSHLQLFVSTFGDIVSLISHSWILQLPIAAHCYSWIRCFLAVFMLIVFAGTGCKHLPEAIHPIADRLPEDIPASLKTFLPVCMILAFISFGIIPFLWLLIFCIWPYVEKKEKAIVALALIVLACAPLDARIQEMFRFSRMPQGSLALYIRASEEGYSQEVHRRALDKIVVNPSDVISYLTVSLSSLKRGDTSAALFSSQKALSLRPNDPVAILQSGNVAYVANDLKTAADYYQKILSDQPEQMDVRFNLSQCYARKTGTAMDIDFVKGLSTKDQIFINDFIATNDQYFSKNWPVLRQFIPADYFPMYFWKNIFPGYNGSWETARTLWGATFFGISPYLSLCISIALLMIFIIWVFIVYARRNKQPISTCRLCKRIICKSCKKGELCLSCFQATNYIRNVKTLATIQSKIIQNRQLCYNVIAYILDIFLPGAGMLLSRKHSLAIIVPVIFLTCFIYASYFFLSHFHLSYPNWVAFGSLDKLPYLLGIYNLFFIVRAIFAVFQKKETVLT